MRETSRRRRFGAMGGLRIAAGVTAVALATLLAILALLAAPRPVLADCLVGSEGCVVADRTSGAPGTRVTLTSFGAGCEPERPVTIVFVDGEYDESTTYPSVELDRATGHPTFVVPRIAAGSYRLGLGECAGDIAGDAANPHNLFPFTFAVLAAPATDVPAFTAIGPLVAIGGLAFLLLVLRMPRRRG